MNGSPNGGPIIRTIKLCITFIITNYKKFIIETSNDLIILEIIKIAVENKKNTLDAK